MQFNTEEENVMMKLFTVIVRVPAVVGIATGAAAITVLLSQTIGWWLPFALVGSALLLLPVVYAGVAFGTGGIIVAAVFAAVVGLAWSFAFGYFGYTVLAPLDLEWWQWAVAATSGVVYALIRTQMD